MIRTLQLYEFPESLTLVPDSFVITVQYIYNIVFVRLRVARTIESGFDHSLQLSHILVPCARFFASIAGVCLQLHIETLLRDIKGLSGELSQEAYLASWIVHFGTETIRSLFD